MLCPHCHGVLRPTVLDRPYLLDGPPSFTPEEPISVERPYRVIRDCDVLRCDTCKRHYDPGTNKRI